MTARNQVHELTLPEPGPGPGCGYGRPNGMAGSWPPPSTDASGSKYNITRWNGFRQSLRGNISNDVTGLEPQ
jgi:hypothetical protein